MNLPQIMGVENTRRYDSVSRIGCHGIAGVEQTESVPASLDALDMDARSVMM